MNELNDFYEALTKVVDKEQSISSMPSWGSNEDHSAKAYEEINKLVEVKQLFIKKNKSKSAYKTKGNYLMTKTEVGKLVGINSQSLFSKYVFSKLLKKHFNKKNKELDEKAQKKINAPKRSHQSKNKSELVSEVQRKSDYLTNLQTKNAHELLQLTLDKLPLDVKRILKLT